MSDTLSEKSTDPCICSAHQEHSQCGTDRYKCPCLRIPLDGPGLLESTLAALERVNDTTRLLNEQVDLLRSQLDDVIRRVEALEDAGVCL